MSNPRDTLATPTGRKVDTCSADYYVFSSPARDVGWSPSAANTPLAVIFCDNKSNVEYINHIIEPNVSPIRRASRFPLSTRTMTSGITGSSPKIKSNLEGLGVTSEESQAWEPSKEARSPLPQPPPSTPQPMRRLFQTPLPRDTGNPFMGYLYDGVELDAENSPGPKNMDCSPRLGKISKSNTPEDDYPFIFSSSPIPLPYHTTDESPTKPKRVPMFPPPASPPPFARYPHTPAHTFSEPAIKRASRTTDTRSKRASLHAGVLSSPSMCYPSAEPLDDDPFLVRAPTPARDRLEDPVSLGHTEFAIATAYATATPREEDIGVNLASDGGSPGRPHTLRKRAGASSRRAGGRKKPAPKRKAAYRKDRGAFGIESDVSAAPPHPASWLSVSPLTFPSINTGLQPSNSRTSAPSRFSNDGDPSTPSFQILGPTTGRFSDPKSFSLGSYTSPSAVFPTPSLTSSFDTPSTIGILPTPGHTTLIPSPEIAESPTITRATRGQGRVTRSRLRAMYAMSPLMAEDGLIGGSKLPESTPDHQIGHRELAEVGLSSIARTKVSGISVRPTRSQGQVHTNANEGNFVREGASYSANVESLQVANSNLPVDRLSISFAPSSASAESEESSPSISSPEALTEGPPANYARFPTTIEVNERQQPKRAHEEDEDQTQVATKRAKVVGEGNASASPSKEGDPNQVDILHGDFGFGRATRSQARAVAALLSFAPSGSSQSINEKRTGRASEAGSLQGEAKKTKLPVTRRTSTRLQGQPYAASEKMKVQTPHRSQKISNIKSGVVRRAPSRVVATPANGIIKTQPTIPTDIYPSGDVIAKGLLSKAQTRAPGTAAGNGNKPQEADHVSGEQFRSLPSREHSNLNSTGSEVKHQVPSELLARPNPSVVFESDGTVLRRTFPKDFPIHEGYPKWYNRNAVSAYFIKNDPARKFVLGDEAARGSAARPLGGLTPNPAPYFNLYIPRFMRGLGDKKFGLCPICVEPEWRGGKGQRVMLNTKISQFNYHMQYYHGISCQTGLPFSPPIAFRTKQRRKSEIKTKEREQIEEGKCHACEKWIPIESVKLLKVMVPELFWWKHAASCHGTTQLASDKNPYIEDSVYLKLREYERASTKGEELKEELGCILQASESPSIGGTAVGSEDAAAFETQASRSPTPEYALAKGGEVGSAENYELSMDLDSDLTDMDEAGDVDMKTLF